MIKAAIKRSVGSFALRLRNWSAEADQVSQDKGPCDDMASPYTLNSLFAALMREKPHQYVWPAVQGAKLAKNLQFDRISFIEFGVAGGNSLLALESLAKRLEQHFQIEIAVYGFDTGTGLPRPRDYRDLPNLWSEGDFRMDVGKLRSRLTKANLVLGPVAETIPAFLNSNHPPIAFVSFDLDYYSSTMEAFPILQGHQRLLLPRVHCYFDDIMGYTYSEFTGERLAITEFNSAHPCRKIAPIYGLRYYVPPRYSNLMWEKYYMLHVFDHDLYGENDGNKDVSPHTYL